MIPWLSRGHRRGAPVGARESRDITDGVAASLHRLAVLLQAGVAPHRAWQLIAASGEHAVPDVGATRDDTELARRLSDAGGPWVDVATIWTVASVVGAPLSGTLRGVARALRDASEARDEVAVALAEPATTARLIAWLPALGVLLVVAFGFDPVVMVQQPLGIACVVIGITLMVAARRWTAALVRAAQPAPGAPGWECDVLAIALTGGVSVERALRVVREAGCPAVDDATRSIIQLSRDSGAPAVELLRAEAAERRRRARTEGRLRAARLGGRLLLPLGACTLPAFLLLGVGPMVLSVVASTPLTL